MKLSLTSCTRSGGKVICLPLEFELYSQDTRQELSNAIYSSAAAVELFFSVHHCILKGVRIMAYSRHTLAFCGYLVQCDTR